MLRLACCDGCSATTAGCVADTSLRTTDAERNDSGALADSSTVSIIVPVLNEADVIADSLSAIRNACTATTEILVVDGGSNDATAEIARALCDRLLISRRGRARQMNAGARSASGTILWFLHSDSRVPKHADELIRTMLAKGTTDWGRFDVQLSGTHSMLRVIERLMNWRSRATGICTGDQGIFVSRKLFNKLGGFPDIALMEDIAMSRLLRRSGRPLCLSQRLVTSSRRWEQNGILRTILLMWKLRLLYFLGVAPETLARKYYGRGS